MSQYSKGGFIPARGVLPTVTVRRTEDGRTEYWDEKRGWMAVLTMAEYHDLLALPELELADEFERNDHG